MATNMKENGFETMIVKYLVENNHYEEGSNSDYNKIYAIDEVRLFRFLHDTQYEKLAELRIEDNEIEKKKFLDRLSKKISDDGVINIIRKGMKYKNKTVDFYMVRPSEGNQEAKESYDKNIFSVTRQLRYSNDYGRLALDVCIFLNGLPIITMELKNQITKQNHDDAIRQYMTDRTPDELLFQFKRCIVHFAVDDDEIYMCTELKKEKSFFMPFNKGNNNGAGNPRNPNGLKTDYLWKDILTKPCLSNILENYVQITEEKDEDTGRKSYKQIFPRYHQLSVVTSLLADAKNDGPGHRYLIQHSAGSGKSNSIAWLAHQLVTLKKDKKDVFDTVIVVTDRVNLDTSKVMNGKEINDQPLYETALLSGTVFQNPRSQFFNVDTTSELAFGLENRGMEETQILKKVDKTVQELKLEKLMNRSIFDLSGGEKQKIACGCVSVCSPNIIILDEPSANLDLKSMEQLHVMIEKWKVEHKTVVIAEHRLAYIWNLIERMVFLKEGKIEFDFSKEEMQKLTPRDLHQMGLRSNQDVKMVHYNRNENIDRIVFKNFVFGYEKNHNILNLKTMEIDKNSITAIVGNNGIGKSTFLRCICGLEKKCKGIMEIDGKVYKRKERLNEIFLVMQDVNHQLFTESVLDEVLISMKKENEEKALDILKSLDLLPYRERHPVSLSGGEKQRVAVATAIASERSVLLFDEPTSGLDYRHMLQVARLFEKLRNHGKTILVVTHDLEFIEALHANTICLEELQA